ncbi:MAG: aspartate aminotransferase family protein [Chromatiales bacterium]|nr:MAG: aspartate aminotransferase family protein [Chromatiales bacterium]
MADLDSEEFRAAAHTLVDQIADFYASLPTRRVTPGEKPSELRALLPANGLPESGQPVDELLAEVGPLLFDHSVHNGHPRFMAYITSSGSPLGALADLLAAAVNPNLGRWDCGPMATEIEGQVIRWLAELIGYPPDCGGLMTSGGNMANFLAFVAARKAMATWDVREQGLAGGTQALTAYVSAEAHTWVDKAADVAGLGAQAIRWVATDDKQRLCPDELTRLIAADKAAGCLPFMVVGTAGTTGTGAIDPLPELANIAAAEGLWFHVDGAYGAPAAALPEAPVELQSLERADSVAIDPHKWLYAPLEAGCTLVRDADALPAAFSFLPSYYKLDERVDGEAPGVNYYNLGMQNSRGFRALKVWLGLRAAGRQGVVAAVRKDIALSRRLYEQAEKHPELEAGTQSLSIATFRYRPASLTAGPDPDGYLDRLNRRLLVDLQRDGRIFVSNAVVDGDYWLRACVVNFRTTADDIDAIPDIVARMGRHLDGELRPASMR